MGDEDLAVVIMLRPVDIALRDVYRPLALRPARADTLKAGSLYLLLATPTREVCEAPPPCRRWSRFCTARRSWSSSGASASSCCCCLEGGMPSAIMTPFDGEDAMGVGVRWGGRSPGEEPKGSTLYVLLRLFRLKFYLPRS